MGARWSPTKLAVDAFLYIFFSHLITTPIQPSAYNWSARDTADFPTCRLARHVINYVFSQEKRLSFLVVALRLRVPPHIHFSSFKGDHPDLDKNTYFLYLRIHIQKLVQRLVLTDNIAGKYFHGKSSYGIQYKD